MSPTNGKDSTRRPTAGVTLMAGGGAGMMEALVCHPLDTIKVRMQLSRRGRTPGTPSRGFIGTGVSIYKREGAPGFYKGLGAVLTGIMPKMAIRFLAFEQYKRLLAPADGSPLPSSRLFVAGLAAGVTEAVAVVTPMEVIKIRLQAQHHSMADPVDVPKYRNAAHAFYTVVREEGAGALWRGVSLTALRQGSNQAVNFTVYSNLKDKLLEWQPEYKEKGAPPLPMWQSAGIGLISGAMGPLSNAPIDTIKTRLQKTPAEPGVSSMQRISRIAGDMFRQEGFHAFYKGITPRVMRVAPGQAVTFAVYEKLKSFLMDSPMFNATSFDKYEE